MEPLTVVSTIDKPTLSSQVAQHLLDLITRERLRPGDEVPSEIQICRDLEVSRGSVREAYRSLAAARRPRDRERPPSAPQGDEPACPRPGLRLRADDGPGHAAPGHGNAPRDRAADRAARGAARERSAAPLSPRTRPADARRARRSHPAHRSRHGAAHDARRGEPEPVERSPVRRASRAARGVDARRPRLAPQRRGSSSASSTPTKRSSSASAPAMPSGQAPRWPITSTSRSMS